MVSDTSNGLCPVLNKNDKKEKTKVLTPLSPPVPQMDGIYVTGGESFFEDLLLVQFM